MIITAYKTGFIPIRLIWKGDGYRWESYNNKPIPYQTFYLYDIFPTAKKAELHMADSGWGVYRFRSLESYSDWVNSILKIEAKLKRAIYEDLMSVIEG